MADITITVKPSFESVGKAIGSVDVSSFLREEINKLAFGIERFGKQLSPVLTGRLRASIHTTPASSMLQAVVATGTDYAIFVHEGTRFMRGRPFMEMGASLSQQAYNEGTMNQRLEEQFVRAFKTL